MKREEHSRLCAIVTKSGKTSAVVDRGTWALYFYGPWWTVTNGSGAAYNFQGGEHARQRAVECLIRKTGRPLTEEEEGKVAEHAAVVVEGVEP